MEPTYRKCLIWIMLAMYLTLAPIPTWNNGDMALCIEEACEHCHDGVAFGPQDDHCAPAQDDACRKSCEHEPKMSDPRPEECFCCVQIPISSYIKTNTPLSRPHDPSGGSIRNVLACSVPDNRLYLNKILFSPVPNPHPVSTQKTLRSVVLII